MVKRNDKKGHSDNLPFVELWQGKLVMLVEEGTYWNRGDQPGYGARLGQPKRRLRLLLD